MPEILSRRDLNRERTRRALFDAAIAVIELEGPEALSVERVVDAAGVSRRTFFNYFANMDALIASGAQDVLDQVAAILAGRPVEESVVDSVLAAVDEMFTVELLSGCARVWSALDRSPAARRFALDAAMVHTEEMAHAWARERLTRAGVAPDSLRESVVMGTLQVAYDEACRQWAHRHRGPVDRAALDDFVTVCHRSFEMVRPVVENPSDF